MKSSKLFFALFLTWAPLLLFGQKLPNILFAIADDASHFSCYGYRFLHTPNIDKLADEGLRFNNMYTPSSKCAPSRAVLLTGRNPWQLEAAANHQSTWPAKFKSVVEVLTEKGYYTGYTGKGWDPGIHPEGRNLTGQEFNKLLCDSVPAKGINKFDYSGNFKLFLQEKSKDRPFFFWYGCKEPHRGYEFMSGVKNGKRLDDLDFLPSFWGTSETVKHDILDYAFEVEYFDKQLGKIIQYLDEAGELENTLIIVSSDNGMPFPRYKGHPYDFSTRVPFVVNWLGKITDPNREVNQFASFIDFAPTILEVANIKQSETGMQKISGTSLIDIFKNKPSGRDFVLTGRERNDCVRPNGWGYPVRSIHKGNFVYMHNFEPDRWPCGDPETGYRDTDGSPTKSRTLAEGSESIIFRLCYGKRLKEELYNIKNDPECLTNLAEKPEFENLKKEMKNELFALLKQQDDPRIFGRGEIFDQYDFERRNKEYMELVNNEKTKKKQSGK